MANLSTKELSSIEDLLTQEQSLIKKYSSYSQTCTDPRLKNECQQIAQKHQNHYNSLLTMLN